MRIGMAPAEVKKTPGATVVEDSIQIEGEKTPALRLDRGRATQMLAELQDGKVWRIRVFDPSFRTAAGARIGMRASALQKLYGPGQILTGEGNVCAAFKKAPGLSFCFAPGSGPVIKTWKDLVKSQLTVHAILVVGKDG